MQPSCKAARLEPYATKRVHYAEGLRVLLVTLVAAPLLLAQDPPVFRSDTELLELEVRVRDKQGRPIQGLTQEPFRLRDNGEEQRIAVFEPVSRDRASLTATLASCIWVFDSKALDSSPLRSAST